MEREQIQDMIDASEARTDTKFERILTEVASLRGDLRTEMADLRGDLRSVNAQMQAILNYSAGTKGVIVGTGVAVFLGLGALFMAVASYGDAIFSRGMSVRDVTATLAKEQDERGKVAAKEQEERLRTALNEQEARLQAAIAKALVRPVTTSEPASPATK